MVIEQRDELALPESCLYVGHVRHQRFAPLVHRFRYSLYMVCLNLDDVDHVFRRGWVWSTRRFAPFSFRREDHLGPADQPLKDSVLDLVEERIGGRPCGTVQLLTNLRCWGYLMSPVSFYYCYDASNTCVQAIVAEVNNTPWGERHCYVLDCELQAEDDVHREEQQKVFHVSPFMEMEMQYHWRVTRPDKEVNVRIDNVQQGQTLFMAELSMQRKPINRWSLLRVGLQHPWMTAKVVLAIYWNALKLWLKGVQYVPHPKSENSEIDGNS